MIKTLQAIFYITWIVVGIILITGVFITITIFPFESIGVLLREGPYAQNERNMNSPSLGPSLNNGPSPQVEQEGPPQISEREREMLSRVLGKDRVKQINNWDDVTPEERQKIEKYYGGSPPNDMNP